MSRIKTWAEIKGEGADLVIDKQAEMKKGGATEKNLGKVIDVLLNEYANILKKKK